MVTKEERKKEGPNEEEEEEEEERAHSRDTRSRKYLKERFKADKRQGSYEIKEAGTGPSKIQHYP